MEKIHEKKSFSDRLITSLNQLNYSTGPTFVAKEFNLRYSGSPISTQTAHNWLNGHAIPSQEKLQILALWLRVSSEWLRFGDSNYNHSIENLSVSSIDAKFHLLSFKQQILVEEIIDSFLHPE